MRSVLDDPDVLTRWALGGMLARGRTERGMTQIDLAHEVAISQSHLSDMEHGRRKPTRTQLDRICIALGIDRDEAHVLLGLLPLDVEAAWLSSQWLRDIFRQHMREPQVY